MPPPLLDLEAIGRTYTSGGEPLTVLTEVSLTIQSGEFVAIMGTSGSGKSTLMNIIGCLDKPSTGTYRIRGVDVASLDGDALAALRRETFGFIFQRYNLMSDLSAVENTEVPAVYCGMAKTERAAHASDLLRDLGLGDRLQHHPNQLSGGQQQRVSIARALMNGGPVILADEPTGALDSQGGKEVMAILEKLHGEGHTIIVVTHDSDIAAHAHRIVRIADGRITSDEQQQKKAALQAQTVDASKDATAGVAVLGESLKMAMRSLLHNRMRTMLTMLGIIIGVASVVALMAIGNGAKQDVLDRIQAMGTDLLTIVRGAPGARASSGIVTSFLPEDLPSIQSVPGVAMAIPETNQSSLVRFGDQDLTVTAVGTGEDFPQVHDWPPQSGVFFTADHVKSYAQVVELGQTVAKNLFPQGTNPLGQYVLIGSSPFQVIGVLSSKGLNSRGDDLDNSVWLPYSTAGARIFGQRFFNNIVVRVSPDADMSVVQAELHTLLIKRHGKEDFNIRNMADTIATASETQNTLTYLLAAIAVISLIVGGIGVMNIMLVSVTERTREIGIRMAIGARSFDVLFQFLTEAVLVCFIGGLAGVAVGIGGGLSTSAIAGWRVIFTVSPIVLAFACAFLTGIVFGYLPARKAARLDPIEALARD
ncbi:MAG TPA: MacB family efflux pump subunit [Bryobacteraceae bacterium]|jgi:macrolide transport system ATP-binding/permease protein|nr:MacB family efflux pump subunit [Bryobacteraceae bacterium]